jgi:hypothetical protein
MLKFLACIILLSLTACSGLPKTVWFQETQELIAAHQYRKALEQISTEQPFNKSLYNHTQHKAQVYRHKQITRIKNLIRQKQWGVAKNALITLEQSQPQHKDWKKIKNLLKTQQANDFRLLKTRLSLKKASLLTSKIEMAQFYQRSVTGPIHWYKQESTLAHEKLALAEELLELSTLAITQQDYQSAQSTYAKAIELNHELKRAHLTEQINQGLSHSNRAAINKRQKQLLKKLNISIRSLDYETMHHYQNILSKAPFSGKALSKSLNKAKKLRKEAAIEKSRRADALYRQRKIEEAIKLWTSAKFLDPELLELDEKLARSLKVQKKLKQLSQH